MHMCNNTRPTLTFFLYIYAAALNTQLLKPLSSFAQHKVQHRCTIYSVQRMLHCRSYVLHSNSHTNTLFLTYACRVQLTRTKIPTHKQHTHSNWMLCCLVLSHSGAPDELDEQQNSEGNIPTIQSHCTTTRIARNRSVNGGGYIQSQVFYSLVPVFFSPFIDSIA